jgi:rod shape-determining protein MreD
MMQPTLLQRMDAAARKLVPFGLTLALMLFALAPTRIPGLAHITPMYALAAIYFWSIYRPDLMGYGTAFGIGVLEDLLTGAPLGSGALILMLCQYLVFRQPKFFNAKPFGVFWMAFGVVALGAGLAKWLCVGLTAPGGFTRFGDMLTSVLMTVAVYPAIAWLLARAQMSLLSQP